MTCFYVYASTSRSYFDRLLRRVFSGGGTIISETASRFSPSQTRDSAITATRTRLPKGPRPSTVSRYPNKKSSKSKQDAGPRRLRSVQFCGSTCAFSECSCRFCLFAVLTRGVMFFGCFRFQLFRTLIL